MIRNRIRRAIDRLRTPSGAAVVREPGLGRLVFHLHAAGDPWISGTLAARGRVHEERILGLLRALLHPGDTMVDVGANIGVFSVCASRLVGPTGQVIAVEPDPANLALLERNAAANRGANILIRAAAAGAAPGTARLFLSTENRGDHRMALASDRPTSVEVAVARLDALVPGGRADLVKMDTQGSEQAAITGMAGLRDANPRLRFVFEYWPHGLVQCGGTVEGLADLVFDRPVRAFHLPATGPVEPLDRAGMIALGHGRYAPETEAFGEIVLLGPDDAEALARVKAL